MFSVRTLTEYALKVVSNRCTLSDAYVAFGTEYPRFYAIYEKVKQTDVLIKASRQLGDANMKIMVLVTLGEKVKELTNMLDRLTAMSTELAKTTKEQYVFTEVHDETTYNDWTIQLQSIYNREKDDATISIDLWKDEVKLAYVGDYEDKEGMEYCLTNVLNDIGYTEDYNRQQEQIKKNKGLQVFLYLLQDNILGR